MRSTQKTEKPRLVKRVHDIETAERAAVAA